MLLSYKWDGYGLGSLCGAIVRASLRDANKTNTKTKREIKTNTQKKTKAKYRKPHMCHIFKKQMVQGYQI